MSAVLSVFLCVPCLRCLPCVTYMAMQSKVSTCPLLLSCGCGLPSTGRRQALAVSGGRVARCFSEARRLLSASLSASFLSRDNNLGAVELPLSVFAKPEARRPAMLPGAARSEKRQRRKVWKGAKKNTRHRERAKSARPRRSLLLRDAADSAIPASDNPVNHYERAMLRGGLARAGTPGEGE